MLRRAQGFKPAWAQFVFGIFFARRGQHKITAMIPDQHNLSRALKTSSFNVSCAIVVKVERFETIKAKANCCRARPCLVRCRRSKEGTSVWECCRFLQIRAVCKVNTKCYLPESLSLPMASDLALSTQPEDTLGVFVKAARKQTWPFAFCVSKETLPLLERAISEGVFQHIGGNAQEPSCCVKHGLLAWQSRKAFLFVDDLLKAPQRCLP